VSVDAARYDLVVFDLDGTLVDSREDLVAAVQHMLRRLGATPLPSETVVGYVGEGARRLVEQSLGGADEARVDEGLAVFRAYYAEHLLDRTLAYPEIPATLERLAAAGCRISVLTNKPEAMSRALLHGLGLLDRFAALIGGDTLATRKPDPQGLLHLAAQAGVAPERALLVGDSQIDVAAARAAGVAFCGALWGFFPERLRRARPERTVARPLDLLAVVGVAGGRENG
jgi:phosphoglycolate phosphatase